MREQKYKMTGQEYDSRVKEQRGRCAICEEERKLCVDHCHDTGKNRELLCSQCNAALGLLKTVSTIRKAAVYLEKHTS